jgi:protocatechuate 3,4-dioxygenase beta subunit
MRLTQLALAIVAAVGLLAGVWFSIRTEPAEARDALRPPESAREELERSEALEAQAGDAALGKGAGSERTMLAGSAASENIAANAPRAASGSEVVGRIVDRDGRGIPDADVYASNGNDWVSIPLDVERDGAPRNWIEIERATTDASGRFAIGGLKPGAVRLAVRASGFAPRAIEDGLVPEDLPRVLPDIVLEPGVVLSGRVVDSSGNGVRGALLLGAFDGTASGQRVSLPGRGVPLATSGTNGEFRVDRMGAGPWHLIVDSPGHMVADARGETRSAGEEVSGLVLRVDGGAEIEGRIQWSSGTPPVDFDSIRVTARPSPESPSNGGGSSVEALRGLGYAGSDAASNGALLDPIRSRPRHATPDASGRIQLRGLIAGMRYRLTAAQRSPDTEYWKTIAVLEPVLAFAGERGVTLAERPSTALVFRVVDDSTGEPLSELTVAAGVGRERLMREDDGEARVSFPEGRVRVPDLRAQPGAKPIQLRVSSGGYRDFERRDIAFTPGVDIDLGDVRLTREHALVVTVVDDLTGTPIEDARVLVGTLEPNELADYLSSPTESNFHGAPNLRFGRTAADGRVRFSSYPGLSVNFGADARGYRAADLRSEILPVDADHAIELRLMRGGVVSVRVRDPSGRPIAKMGIAHLAPDAAPSDEPDGPGFDAAAYTNSLGIARFDALAPGMHSFRTCDGPARAMKSGAVPWVPVTVADRSSAEVTLTAPARARFFGVVTEGGVALARARMRLVERREEGSEDEEEEDVALDAVTDREGRFEFENVRAAQYELWIAHSTRRMAERFPITLLEGDNNDDFDLGVACVEGRVVDEAGEPVAQVAVSAGAPGEDTDRAQLYDMEMREDDRGNVRLDSKPTVTPFVPTDELGRYHLRGVRSGESLVVNVRGETVEATSSEPLSLGPGEVRRGLDFVVRRAGALELSLVGDSPAGSREWFEVRVESIEPAAIKTDRRTHLGTFIRSQRVRALGPGRYRVRCFPMGNEGSPRLQTQEIEIAAGEVAKVAFQAR